MFSAMLERSSGERVSGTAFLTLSVLSGYTVIATVVAGGFAVPAGLFVFVLGGLATIALDHALWREAAFAPDARRSELPQERPQERLAPPADQAALPAPRPRKKRAAVSRPEE